MTDVRLIHLGQRTYQAAYDIQLRCKEAILAGEAPSTLLLVEHPPTLTKGAGFHPENLLLPEEEYAAHGIELLKSDRGGDITYHEPGQLVLYPIFDLQIFGKDLHLWLRNLEESVMIGLAELGIESRRFPPNTGVWVGDAKVAAMGVKVTKWISLHGIAINCNNTMEGFDLVVPCGIEGYGVTSISLVLGRDVSTAETWTAIRKGFESVFSIVFTEHPWQN